MQNTRKKNMVKAQFVKLIIEKQVQGKKKWSLNLVIMMVNNTHKINSKNNQFWGSLIIYFYISCF